MEKQSWSTLTSLSLELVQLELLSLVFWGKMARHLSLLIIEMLTDKHQQA
jgi:hypothetical protein